LGITERNPTRCHDRQITESFGLSEQRLCESFIVMESSRPCE
jgi:hypothetical protein